MFVTGSDSDDSFFYLKVGVGNTNKIEKKGYGNEFNF